MAIHSKTDLAVTALLHNLSEELDRKKRKKVEDLMLTKSQSSVLCRLGPRINEQDLQISHCRGGGELCGAIFMCNRRTWKECLGQCLFGLPISKKGLVEQVVPRMKLFLFEYEKRQLWGVFEATSHGRMDIIRDAYSGGSFPCQVRVKIPEECVALYEEEFCEAIQDNYFSFDKFHFELSGKQVCHLITLFERKYFRAERMHSDAIEYEERQHRYNPNGRSPLLLTNDAACLYNEDSNITSLPPSLYPSRCHVLQDQSLSKGGVGFVYKNVENSNNNFSKLGHRSNDTGPLCNGAYEIVQNNCFPWNVDIASLANIGGQLGKGSGTVNASCLTCHDSNNRYFVEEFIAGDVIPGFSTVIKQESIETLVFPSTLSQLHSDRPIGKSVWARISGRSKPPVELENPHMQGKSGANPVLSLPLKEHTISESAVASGSFVDANQEAAEQCLVGFKRRRASKTTANADETPRRRRKLTRPVFANAPVYNQGSDNMQAEHNVCHPSTLDLNLPAEALSQHEHGDVIGLYNTTTPEAENQLGTGLCQVSLDAEVQSFTKSEQHIGPFNDSGPNCLDEEMRQEPCALAFSLTTQETVNSLLRSKEGIDGNNPAHLIGNLQKQPEALQDVKQDSTSVLVNVPIISNALSKQVDRADGEDAGEGNGFPVEKEQGFDLLQAHVLSECASLDRVAADSSRASTLSLAPCTPAKDFLNISYPVIKQVDDRKGDAVLSHELAQDIPLTLELGNDVKLHLHDNVNPGLVSDELSKEKVHNEVAVLDVSSNGTLSTQSETISLDCTSSSNLLNQVDVKSFLSGLQVSSIRLQLGASPCLILQLGDHLVSNSVVDSQDQEGKGPSLPETNLSETSNTTLIQRPSSN